MSFELISLSIIVIFFIIFKKIIMTSILSVEEIIEKLNSLNKNSLPRWGEMSSSQMIKHCSSFIDLYLGKIKVPIFLVQIFWYYNWKTFYRIYLKRVH